MYFSIFKLQCITWAPNSSCGCNIAKILRPHNTVCVFSKERQKTWLKNFKTCLMGPYSADVVYSFSFRPLGQVFESALILQRL